MIEFIIFGFNLLLINIIFFNPLLFAITTRNKYFKNIQNVEILIYFIILINFFLIFSFSNFLNKKLEIIFYLIFIISIFFIIFLNKKLIKSNYFIDLFFIFLISLILTINIFSNPLLGWDGNFWIEKAQIFYKGGSFIDLRETIFPNYPHLGGYLWGIFWKSSILDYEIIGRASFVLIYVFSIYQLCSSYKFNYFHKLICVLILITLTYRVEHFVGYQDILIFSFILFSYILLNKYKENPSIFNLIIFNFSISLLLWIKNEGIISYFIFFILFLFLNKKNKIIYHVYIFIILYFVLLISKFLIFYYLNNNLVLQDGISFYNLNSNLSNPSLLISKILIILKFFLVKIFYIPLFITMFFLIVFAKSIRIDEIIFCLLVLALYSLPYLFSSDAFDNSRLVWHLKTSYDRMLLQCVAFFLPFSLKCLKNFLK